MGSLHPKQDRLCYRRSASVSRKDSLEHQREIEKRRLRDAQSSSLWKRANLKLHQRYKSLLFLLGIETLPDILKEFVRGKLMDALYDQLGGFGLWLKAYPLAFFTVGLCSVIAWLAIITVRESRKPRHSIICDEQAVPYTRNKVSRRWAYSFVALASVCTAALLYGTFRYYQISRGHFRTVEGKNVQLPLIAAINGVQAGIPAIPPSNTPPSMLSLFTNDFPSTMKVSEGLVLEGRNLPMREQMYLDFPAKSEFVGFYIPVSTDPPSGELTFKVCMALRDRVWPFVDDFPKSGLEIQGGIGLQTNTIDELTFTGRVVIYYEDFMSMEQLVKIMDAYKRKKLDVQFRDASYLAGKTDEWRQQLKKKN
jgi:hypothetical protein